MQRFFVYIFVNHNTGYPVYIGKGCKDRDLQHKSLAKSGRRGYLYNWMRKYQNINGTWPIPFRIIDGVSEQDAFSLKKHLIGYFGRLDLKTGCLFNCTDGGEGCCGKSPELIALLRAQKIGRKLSPESIAKRTLSVIGSKRSAETCARISAAQRGRKQSDATRAKLSVIQRGKVISPETRAKISISNKGKPSWNKGKTTPAEVKEKMSLAHKGKVFTIEQRHNMSIGAKKRYAVKL